MRAVRPALRTRYLLRAAGAPLPVKGSERDLLASGRAACDWPSVFAIAADEEWPLTAKCPVSGNVTIPARVRGGA